MRNWLKVRMITGFFVTIPAIATAWILWVFWSRIDDIFGPMYERAFGRPVHGLGFLTAVTIILLMGTLARNVVGRRVLSWGDTVLERLPVFGRLYPSVKMLVEAFSPERRSGFKAVVLVQHPREGGWAFGFVTSEVVVESPTGKQEMNTVFVPTNNLYLGDVVVVPRAALHDAHRRDDQSRAESARRGAAYVPLPRDARRHHGSATADWTLYGISHLGAVPVPGLPAPATGNVAACGFPSPLPLSPRGGEG